jgi:hypothetical protein
MSPWIGAPLLPTGVPNGVDEAPPATWSSGQTCQVQKRIGREDQTPMCPNGFGTAQAQPPSSFSLEKRNVRAWRISHYQLN